MALSIFCRYQVMQWIITASSCLTSLMRLRFGCSALIEGALRSFQEWIAEDIQNISVSKIFQMAPFLRHSIPDVIFFFAWLTKFSSGPSTLYHNTVHFLCVKNGKELRQNVSVYLRTLIKSEHTGYTVHWYGTGSFVC
jgi:hypothetical protein